MSRIAYLKRKAAGLCIRCPLPASPGITTCEVHRSMQKERNALYKPLKRKYHYHYSTEERRVHQLKQLYGLSLEDYNSILKMQKGHCAICPTTPKENGQALAVDHDHKCCPGKGKSCGKCIRGLLCSVCNLCIGLIRDNPMVAIKMFDYLNSWRDNEYKKRQG